MESFHAAVQRAPTGVGSSAGGAEAAAGPEGAASAVDEEDEAESVEARTEVARRLRRVRSFIVNDRQVISWKGVTWTMRSGDGFEL